MTKCCILLFSTERKICWNVTLKLEIFKYSSNYCSKTKVTTYDLYTSQIMIYFIQTYLSIRRGLGSRVHEDAAIFDSPVNVGHHRADVSRAISLACLWLLPVIDVLLQTGLPFSRITWMKTKVKILQKSNISRPQ